MHSHVTKIIISTVKTAGDFRDRTNDTTERVGLVKWTDKKNELDLPWTLNLPSALHFPALDLETV